MKQHTILIVDDEPLIRMDLASMIEDLGYVAWEAGSAEEAIAILEGPTWITAVITDIDMPGTMDGRALARAIRDRWPPCKLIVVSGQHRLNQQDLPDGVPFVSKPIPPGQLEAALHDVGL